MEIINKQAFSKDFRKTLLQVESLPPLPETTHDLLMLRNNLDANLSELTEVIERDPSLAAFVMKYSRMAMFGYGSQIKSVNQAISLALGFNTTLNITIGVSSAGCLKIPNNGLLGRVCIWTQALECAALCRELQNQMTEKPLVDSGLAYLSGLFHNFGYLLFGHLYPKHFDYLNNLASRYPEQDVRILELQTFGITHDIIGMYLIKAWELPDEIAIAVSEHHFPDYEGEHSSYAKLVAIANRLLRNQGMLDACPYIETSLLLESLGIDEFKAETALEKIRGCQDEFQLLSKQLAV